VPLLLILDSLGTSELLLILAVALIFFGPRKLPQISRQIGKSLAEFRKASEDFKSTWAREVALETESQPEPSIWPHGDPTSNSNLSTTVERSEPVQSFATATETSEPLEITPESQIATPAASFSAVTQTAPPEPTHKSDWL
jgi:Tat protein translocase TatB subunit